MTLSTDSSQNNGINANRCAKNSSISTVVFSSIRIQSIANTGTSASHTRRSALATDKSVFSIENLQFSSSFRTKRPVEGKKLFANIILAGTIVRYVQLLIWTSNFYELINVYCMIYFQLEQSNFCVYIPFQHEQSINGI